VDDIKYNCNIFITFTLHTYITDRRLLFTQRVLYFCLPSEFPNECYNITEYTRTRTNDPDCSMGIFLRSCSDNPRTDNR